MERDVIVHLHDVQFAYPRQERLFRALHLAVYRGDRLGLVGANGSGKTTLFHLMVGLVKIQSGGLEVLGRTISSEADYRFARTKLGLLFQDSDDQLFCPTVAEDVAFGPLNLGLPADVVRRRVSETLQNLDLAGYENRVSHKLSGGEKRLVALATILAMQPEILLLDEPANGLDPQARRDLIALLARIPCTQVIASHDLEFVRATCTRVVVMHQGQLLADGPTDAILSNADLMLTHGLEVPYSIEVERGQHAEHRHRHGVGPSHGHGHLADHDAAEHRPAP